MPQLTEQALHSVQVSHSHSEEQQSLLSTLLPSQLPPFTAGVCMERLRVLLVLFPGAQASGGQYDHAAQGLQTQSAGQRKREHSLFSRESPSQTGPPNFASFLMVRSRFMLPVPQVTLQPLQTVHSAQMQPSGHNLRSSQGAVSLNCPTQAAPLPKEGLGPRIRLLVPLPPHVTEHVDHGSQSCHVQSTGHANALHSFDSFRSPTQN